MRFLGGSFLSTLSISILLHIITYHLTYACEQGDESVLQPSFLQLADKANVIVVAEVTAIENNMVSVEVSQYLKGGGGTVQSFYKPIDSPCDENLVVGQEQIIFARATQKDRQGVFIQGKTASVTERNIHLITLNESQNDFLHKKSCAAVYDGEHLTVPCVKTVGSEIITQAELQQIGTELSFTLTQTMPYYTLTAPKIDTDSTNSLISNYAAIENVELQFQQDPVQIFALVKGHFSNGCEYFKPRPTAEIRANKEHIFPLFLTVSKPYAGQQCNDEQRPFALKIKLFTNDLPTGEYVLKVNDSYTQTFSF